MKFKTQINNKISSIEYTNTEDLPIHILRKRKHKRQCIDT